MNQEQFQISCQICNKIFITKRALFQHSKAKSHLQSQQKNHITTHLCPNCNKSFTSAKSLLQHKRAVLNNQKKIDRNIQQIQKPLKSRQKRLVLYENVSIWERMKIAFHRICSHSQIIILDECVEKDPKFITLFHQKYQINYLPPNLRTYKDHELRLILLEKRWGIISKDYEMCMIAHEMQISPVYYLKETLAYRSLIRISSSKITQMD